MLNKYANNLKKMLPTKWHMFKNEKSIPGLPSQVGKSIN